MSVIETSVGPVTAVTLNKVLPKMLPDVAVIVVEPALTPVARPEAEIVAMELDEELQVAVAVKFCVLPSL